MISKKNRINRQDFETILKKGELVSSSFFNSRFLRNTDNTTHFSVVISKKVAKTAVLRNKIRRRIYSILKEYVKNPYFIVIFVKKGSEKVTFKETKENIQKLLKKAKII